jgi:hypothetical protein
MVAAPFADFTSELAVTNKKFEARTWVAVPGFDAGILTALIVENAVEGTGRPSPMTDKRGATPCRLASAIGWLLGAYGARHGEPDLSPVPAAPR